MNYLIFDNDVYYDLDGKNGIAPKSDIQAVFKGTSMETQVLVIDTLQKQVAAPEKIPLRRDEVLSSAFTGEYLTQAERISENLFQVIAVEKPRINEVYKILGFENVKLLIPYAVALREFLKVNNLLDDRKKVVFLDHLGDQVLLTIFNKGIFTTPRRLTKFLKTISTELKRSEEHYRSQNKSDETIKFLIITNSKEILDEIVLGGGETKDNIVFVEDTYPALIGLKQGKFSMHYMLPEQFIRLRELELTKKRVFKLGIMLGILAIFMALVLGVFSINRTAAQRLKNLQLEAASLDRSLEKDYSAKYKDILRKEKKVNFPYYLNSFLKTLPSDYNPELISIREVSAGRYRFEALISLDGKDRPFSKMRLSKVFKGAKQENILVKDNPGLKITLDIP
ncbi:MAG: hypothetical protein C4533_00065 [Candidatus Omnitrophota bacterium]|jgi:hypothetical protein|nr:MAG: hypothetical protein C4533_00065 [Candidatus Omnitrophota bacterium]